MIAEGLINRVVVEQYRDKAHVRGIIDTTWWHIHKNEEVPRNTSLEVIVRLDNKKEREE